METFKAWAGVDSDISYYLNSHHIDINESMVPGYQPVRVMASGARGIATDLQCAPGTEDTITLLVDWAKKSDDSKRATGVYTAGWVRTLRHKLHDLLQALRGTTLVVSRRLCAVFEAVPSPFTLKNRADFVN